MNARAPINDLSAEYVRSILDYEPSTGIFTWKWRSDVAKHINERLAGRIAGALIQDGYVGIGIRGRQYRAHRLAWVHTYGFWPESGIDHINGVCHDNRIENLRAASQSENLANTRAPRNNSSGFKGVFWRKRDKKWVARIGVGKKMLNLGVFASFQEARDARLSAELIHQREFSYSISRQIEPSAHRAPHHLSGQP